MSTRDEAVLILTVCASRRANLETKGTKHDNDIHFIGLWGAMQELEASADAHDLANAAYHAVPVGMFEEECAEAAALVESGWEPGDELEYLNG